MRNYGVELPSPAEIVIPLKALGITSGVIIGIKSFFEIRGKQGTLVLNGFIKKPQVKLELARAMSMRTMVPLRNLHLCNVM